MTRYRGALVGLGGIATQSHLPAARRRDLTKRFEIVAAVDPMRVGERVVDGLPVHADLDELLAEQPIDFVDIATPTATHVSLSRLALEHELHVLCEKPVALTRGDAEALVNLSCARHRVLVPCHQYRANPVWRRIRQWLDEGAIGRWHLCEIAVYRTQADRGTSADQLPWRVRKRDAVGGVLLDHGTHLLYTVLDLDSSPTGISAWIDTLAHRNYEVEDTAQIRVQYVDRVATLFLTWAARRRETRVHIVGERGSISWIDGALSIERDGALETIDCSRELDKKSYTGWFADLFSHFADVLDAGASGPIADASRADVVRVATLLEAAYKSAELGGVVRLDPPTDSLTPGTQSAAAR
jgi:predicted dehydrogenase